MSSVFITAADLPLPGLAGKPYGTRSTTLIRFSPKDQGGHAAKSEATGLLSVKERTFETMKGGHFTDVEFTELL